MSDIHDEIEIQATPDQVWRVLGDLAAASRYVPGIASSRMDGSTRICVMADGQEIHEAITDVSTETLSYCFEHIKTPMPVKRSSGRFQVAARGANAIVRVEAHLEAAAPETVEMMSGGLRQTLENLRACVKGRTE